jgi:hypothetical protein
VNIRVQIRNAILAHFILERGLPLSAWVIGTSTRTIVGPIAISVHIGVSSPVRTGMQKYGAVDVTAVRDIIARVPVAEASAKNILAFAALDES